MPQSSSPTDSNISDEEYETLIEDISERTEVEEETVEEIADSVLMFLLKEKIDAVG